MDEQKSDFGASLLDGDDLSYHMGFGSWRPKWLQTFNSMKWFMTLLAIFSLVQGVVVAGLVTISIESVEREFGFSSKVSGLILAGNDAGALIVVTFVSFFGSKSKPKWMALGAIVSGFGGFLYALPKLLAGSYEPQQSYLDEKQSLICSSGTNRSSVIPSYCDNAEMSGHRMLYAVIFVTAQLIMGAGTAPIRTLGPAYLDENVAPRASPIYLGIWFASLMMGPGVGFTVGSRFLSIYTDIQVPSKLNLRVGKTGWVGAWWLGFVALSGAFVMLGCLFSLYPKQMIEGRKKRQQAIENGELPAADKHIQYTVSGYLRGCLKLVHNKVFILGTVGLTVKTIYAVGLSGFVLKIIVVKFGVSQVKGGMIIGVSIFCAMTAGVMLGAFGMRKVKVKLSGKTGAKVCTIISLLTIVNGLIWAIPGCKDTNMAGVMVPYNDSTTVGSLISPCNRGCDCSQHKYEPVCGGDGLTYHSPCYAGCTQQNKTAKSYSDCSCVHSKEATAVKGKCERHCKNLYLFFALMILGAFISFAGGTPHKVMMLRCVPDNHRAFSLGVQYLIMKGFSFMPGPIVLGAIVDSFCITWRYDECGDKKSCLDYDINGMSHSLLLFSITTQVIGTGLYALCWRWYPSSEDMATEDTDTGVEDNIQLTQGT